MVADPEILALVAVTVGVPVASAVASPLVEIVTFDSSEELHVTRLLTSRAVPSVYLPTATSCCMVFGGVFGADGEMLICDRAAGPTVKSIVLLTDPEVAVTTAAPIVRPVTVPSELTVTTLSAEELQVTLSDRSCV